MSAWVRALREKSSGLDGPELTEDDGWPGSTRDPPTGFQPEFPPRPRGGDPESCPGVSTRVSRVLTSCCASRHKFSLGCGVGTQHLVPGSRKEGTRRPVLGPDPFPPSRWAAAGTRRLIPGSRPEFPISTVGWGHGALSCYCARSRASGHSLWSRGRRREDRTAPNGPLGSKGGGGGGAPP